MILKIRVKSESPKEGIILLNENEWLVMLSEKLEDEKINISLLRLVANKLGISSEKIRFLKGVKARRKILEII